MKKTITTFALFLALLNFFAKPILADTTYVSGTIVNQTWTTAGSPYVFKDGDIQIAGLTINPGVRVLAGGNFQITIAGVINAIGSEQSNIIFTTRTNTASWKGILFQNSVPGSNLAWCIVEKANSSGIRIVESLPSIRNCTIQNNQTSTNGGGIRIANTIPGDIVITDCMISNNQSISNSGTSYGGGIHVSITNGTAHFIRDTLKNNQAKGRPSTYQADGGGISIFGDANLMQCSFLNNAALAEVQLAAGSVYSYGGGIFIGSGEVTISNCSIRDNDSYAHNDETFGRAYAYGGGIYISRGITTIKNSIIAYDSVRYLAYGGSYGGRYGSGIYFDSGQVSIVNSTIVFNNIEAIYKANSNISILNSIIYFNNNNGTQLSDTLFNATYSDIYRPGPLNYPGIGNIDLNPILDNTFQIVAGSPCIDSGNANIIYNDVCFPPSLGTGRNDIGANGGPEACNWPVTVIQIVNNFVPANHLLFQNYPNPFNPTTNIKFDIPKKSFVKLVIYNSLGKEVTTLVNEELNAGSYQTDWVASEFPSGIYFYRVETESIVQTKSMMLIK